jgi:hypothetical protein
MKGNTSAKRRANPWKYPGYVPFVVLNNDIQTIMEISRAVEVGRWMLKHKVSPYSLGGKARSKVVRKYGLSQLPNLRIQDRSSYIDRLAEDRELASLVAYTGSYTPAISTAAYNSVFMFRGIGSYTYECEDKHRFSVSVQYDVYVSDDARRSLTVDSPIGRVIFVGTHLIASQGGHKLPDPDQPNHLTGHSGILVPSKPIGDEPLSEMIMKS